MEKEKENDLLVNILGSATASIISRLTTHPLDTIKAKIQAHPKLSSNTFNNAGSKLGTTTQYKGPIDVCLKIFRTEGINGFYKGLGAVIVGGTPGTVVYLCSYDFLKQKLSNDFSLNKDDDTFLGMSSSILPKRRLQNEFMIHFLAGMIAESIACIIYVPVDVVKERLQVQNNPITNSSLPHSSRIHYHGSWNAFTKIMQNEGVKGLYKGYGATLASFGPFSAFYFMLFEQFKQEARKRNLRTNNDKLQTKSNEDECFHTEKNNNIPFNQLLLCSSCAGAISSWITSPFDMVKLRLQIQIGNLPSNNNIHKNVYRGMIHCLRKSYTEGGFNGLFRGAGARVLHFTPATAITMTSYETCRNFYTYEVR